MKYSGSMTHDLRFGEEAEKWAKDLYGGYFKVEIKSDRMAIDTGRIYIELKSRGNDSGLRTTDADIWLYNIEGIGTQITFTVGRLKELVIHKYLLNKFNGIEPYTFGGDNNSSMGMLLDFSDFFIKNLFSVENPPNDNNMPKGFFI